MPNSNGFISINDVADVVKSALGSCFVYRTKSSKPGTVTVDNAIRQDEEFSALFSPVLWDEFIPGGAKTSGSKLSTLFNRKLSYVKRHGLVTPRNKYCLLVTEALFIHEKNHVEQDLIHLGARKLAHGTDYFDEKKIAQDENRTLDYNASKAKITEKLAYGLTELINEKEPHGKICLVISALRERGYIDGSKVTLAGVPTVLSVLLLLSLNLFSESDPEYVEIVRKLRNIILADDSAAESSESCDLSKQRVAEILFELSRLAGEKLDRCDKISCDDLVGMLQNLF